VSFSPSSSVCLKLESSLFTVSTLWR
jgi:hypothetical protein